MMKIETLNGVDIFVTEDGKFYAEVNGKRIERTSISAVRRLVSLSSSAVRLLDVSRNWNKSVIEVEILGFERGRARCKDGKLCGKYEKFYYATAEQKARLLKIYARQRELDQQWQDAVESLVYVDDDNFRTISKKASA